MTAVAAPYVLGTGEGRWHARVSGIEIDLLARAEDTGGRLTFMRYQAPAGFTGPPLHVHRDLDEAILVLEGRFVVRLGEDEHDLGPGEFAWMPRDVAHGFANVGDTVGTWVGFVSPPGRMEAFFAAVHAELADLDGPPDPERLMALNVQHGIEVLGPPIRTPAQS